MYFLLVNLTVEMINWEINECTLIVSIVPALKSDDEKLVITHRQSLAAAVLYYKIMGKLETWVLCMTT